MQSGFDTCLESGGQRTADLTLVFTGLQSCSVLTWSPVQKFFLSWASCWVRQSAHVVYSPIRWLCLCVCVCGWSDVRYQIPLQTKGPHKRRKKNDVVREVTQVWHPLCSSMILFRIIMEACIYYSKIRVVINHLCVTYYYIHNRASCKKNWWQ